MGICRVTIKFFSSLLFDSFNKNKEYTFTEKDIERRERLIQIYIVVLGLLISNTRYPILQELLMKGFMIFLFASLWYYFLLTRFFNLVSYDFDRSDLNTLALIVAAVFSSLLNIYSFSLNNGLLLNDGSLNISSSSTVYIISTLISIIILTVIVSASLFV